MMICLFRDGTLCDVTLKSADGKEIHAHKCVLVSNSDYFEKLITGKFQEANQRVIQIQNINGVVLKNLIDYMYTGVLVSINEDNVDVMIFYSSHINEYNLF